MSHPKTLLITSCIILLVSGCFGKVKRPDRKLTLTDEQSELTHANMEAGDRATSKAKPPKQRKRLPPKQEKPHVVRKPTRDRPTSQIMETKCRSVYQKFANPYRFLLSKHPAQNSVDRNDPTVKMLLQPESDCIRYDRAIAMMEAIINGISSHQGRIGVMLPLTGLKGQLGSHILQGMRAAAETARIPFDQVFVVKDTMDDPRRAENLLSELVFSHKVAAVVGGFNQEEAKLLVSWSDQLYLPTFIINRDTSLVNNIKNSFRIYPDEFQLAKTLAIRAKANGINRVAVLRPITGKSDNLIENFKYHFTALGGAIASTLPYSQENFESMDAVSRDLFQIDAPGRRAEYQRAYWRARSKAKAQGMPFDPRLVVLKPIVSVDGIFIPDDFRTIRHFAKLFRYHGVEQLPLIGNHEWRSQALIDPYDQFLDQSLFADFIGSYQDIPDRLRVPLMNGPYFVAPQHVMQVDFQLIGFRAAQVILPGVVGEKQMRHKLGSFYEQLTLANAAFFPGGRAFDQRHTVFWPTFVFDVGQGGIILSRDPAKARITPPKEPYQIGQHSENTSSSKGRRELPSGNFGGRPPRSSQMEPTPSRLRGF